MARSSSIDVKLRLRGQRQFSREVRTTGAELEAMGLKGAAAVSKFAAKRDALKSFGRNWSRNVTLPILAAGGIATKMAIDWEDAFAGVRKTVNGTGAQLAALDVGLRNMSMKIPVSATELAEIAEAAGQLGIKRQAILGFTRVVADLGVATNLVGEEGASSLAKFANITQMPERQFSRLGSTIVALGNAGASTEKDIMALGLRLAAAGSFVGMSESQILGFSNTLSSLGIEAEAGGTAMSATFKTINSAVSEGGARLGQFAEIAGVSSGKFAKAWKRDAASATATWIEGLGQLKKEGKDVPAILSELAPKLRGERVQDTLLRAAGAGDLLRKSLGLGAKSWKQNNALSQEASKRYKTLKSQLQILKNIAVNFAVVIGRELVPAIKDFATWLGPKIKKATQLFGGLSKPIKTAAIGAAALLAVVGPLGWGLGALADGVGNALKAIKLLTGATWLWNAALLANPITWIVLGIAALVAGFIIAYKKIGWFRDGVDAVFKWIKGALAAFIGFVKNNWEAILILLTGPFGIAVVTIIKHFDAIKKVITGAVTGTISFLKSAWQSPVFKILSWPIRTYIKFQVKLWMAVKDVLLKAFGIIKSVWPAVSDFLKDPIGNAVKFIRSAFNGVVSFIGSVPGRIAAAARGMFNGIKEAFRGAINFIIRGWNSLHFTMPSVNTHIPGVGTVGGFDVGVPDIPELAHGGDIRRQGAAIVGDRGPELLQLPRAARVTPLDPPSISLKGIMGGVKTVVVQSVLDGKVVAESVADVAANEAALA